MGNETAIAEVVENSNSLPLYNPTSLLQIAIEKDFDIDRLSKLMDLSERYEKAEAKKAFHEAMTQFKSNPPQIIKDRKVSYGNTKYTHASLANVVETITQALSKVGLSLTWNVANEPKENLVKVETIITHIKGHSESLLLQAAPDNSGKKNSVQAIGSTTTYLQRYGALAITGLATNEFENDGCGDIWDDYDFQPAPQEDFNRIINTVNSLKNLVGSDFQLKKYIGAEYTDYLEKLEKAGSIDSKDAGKVQSTLNSFIEKYDVEQAEDQAVADFFDALEKNQDVLPDAFKKKVSYIYDEGFKFSSDALDYWISQFNKELDNIVLADQKDNNPSTKVEFKSLKDELTFLFDKARYQQGVIPDGQAKAIQNVLAQDNPTDLSLSIHIRQIRSKLQ